MSAAARPEGQTLRAAGSGHGASGRVGSETLEVIHELPLERRTLHGHFSRELSPVLTLEPGDTVRFSTLDAGWGLEPPALDGSGRRQLEPRDPELDAGHALVGPIEVRGARAGQTLAVRIDTVRVGSYGLTTAGGASTPLNERLGVADGTECLLVWELDADAGVARDQHGHTVELRPFLGVLGMRPRPASIRRYRRPRAAATSTAPSSWPGRRSTSRSPSTAPSSPPATGTRGRATARCRSSRSSARSSAPS